MNEHSKNINGLSLLNIDNSREKRKKIFLRQTGKNLIKNLNSLLSKIKISQL